MDRREYVSEKNKTNISSRIAQTQANFSAPTLKPAHEARAGQRFSQPQLRCICNTLISCPQASSPCSELSTFRLFPDVIACKNVHLVVFFWSASMAGQGLWFTLHRLNITFSLLFSLGLSIYPLPPTVSPFVFLFLSCSQFRVQVDTVK